MLTFVYIISLWSPGTWASEAVSKRPKDPLQGVKSRLAKQYPDVEHISIATYLRDYPHALLIDVRDADEFAVSRIPGAVHIGSQGALLEFAKAHPDQPLILYCSVGARSAAATAFLQAHQVNTAKNLAGSIFEWSNMGRPLVNNQGDTDEVHPYNAFRGWRYLEERPQKKHPSPTAP